MRAPQTYDPERLSRLRSFFQAMGLDESRIEITDSNQPHMYYEGPKGKVLLGYWDASWFTMFFCNNPDWDPKKERDQNTYPKFAQWTPVLHFGPDGTWYVNSHDRWGKRVPFDRKEWLRRLVNREARMC